MKGSCQRPTVIAAFALLTPLSLAKMSQLTQAFPDEGFWGIGGISTFEHALNYFLIGCGTVQICTAAMLDHAIGPNVIRELNDGLARFLEKQADRGSRIDDFVAGRTRRRTTADTKRPRAMPRPMTPRPRARESRQDKRHVRPRVKNAAQAE